jgi:hypothetical protein
MSSDLSDGTTTVTADGGNMIAIKGSHYQISTGDEGGTIGGLTSNTFKKETDWLTYSFKVMMDGGNACRLTDKHFHNHKNTINAQGDFEIALVARDVLQEIVDNCNEDVSPADENGNLKTCTRLGAEKHACCERKIQEHREENPPDGDPPIEGEQGYQRPSENDRNNPFSAGPPTPTAGSRSEAIADAISNIAAGMDRGRAFGQALGGNCFPDAAILNPDGSRTFVDFKFPCPEGHPTANEGTSRGGANTQMSPLQQSSYDALGIGSGNGPAEVISPQGLI